MKQTKKLLPQAHGGIRQAVLDVLDPHFSNQKRMFASSVEFYNLLSDDVNVQKAARQMYAWLGIKPRSLKVKFITSQNALVIADEGHLYINSQFRNHPYQVGALLAFGLVEDVLTNRYDREVDQVTVEHATIWCGFGSLVLNGLAPPSNTLVLFHHYLNGDWQLHQAAPPKALGMHEYGELFITNLKLTSVPFDQVMADLTPQARKLIDVGYHQHVPKPSLPTVVKQHHHAAQQRWVTTLLYIIITSATCLLMLYVVGQGQD